MPDLTNTEALVLGGYSKGESAEDLPAFLISSASDYGCELK